MCYVAVKAACYMLRGSLSIVLYVTWQYEQRVMVRGSKSSVLYVT